MNSTASFSFRHSFQKGFTLIELMIAISIMILMVGVGVAAYLNMDKRQNLSNAGKQLQLLMRAAQTKARVGERPTGCQKLLGYRVSQTSVGPDIVSLEAVCENGGATTTYLMSDYSLPVGVTVQNMSPMTFRVLHGGVESSGDVTLSSEFPTYTFVFTVNAGGEITEGTLTKGE
jgi:prepilin-type N-terminal cleavage/methylation domain-containing protein